jgi:3-mercaptopyruvate sulfurtransferase SseA
MAQNLMKMGYSEVFALKGGWHEWNDAKYPVEKKHN